jgi:hypothetical protein
MSTNAALEVLSAYREAARELSRDESLGSRRFALIVALVDRARRDHGQDAWLMLGIRRVIASEARELLVDGRTPTAPAATPTIDPVTRALQALRRRGLDRCTTCLRAIPSAEALEADVDREVAAWHALVSRERAPQQEAEAAHGEGDRA